MPCNIEIKARVSDADKLLNNVLKFTDTPTGTELLQEDTFFNVSRGRLKLRQLKHEISEATLIFYERPDNAGVKLSQYQCISVIEPDNLKTALVMALGIKGVVRKRRMVYMIGQTRVHLDQVEGLGNFMELEVVLHDGQSAEEGEKIAADLMMKLEICKSDLLSGAYMDLLMDNDRQTNLINS